MTSFVTSIGAESVGYEVKNGIAHLRASIAGPASGGHGFITGLTRQGLWLAIAMILLAGLGVMPYAQRIFEAKRQMVRAESFGGSLPGAAPAHPKFGTRNATGSKYSVCRLTAYNRFV